MSADLALVEEMTNEFLRTLSAASIPPEWKLSLIADPWGSYDRFRKKRPRDFLNMPIPPRINRPPGCGGEDGAPFSWRPSEGKSVLFLPRSLCVGAVILVKFLAAKLEGNYPDPETRDLTEVLNYRERLAREMLRSWGLPRDEGLIREGVLRSTKLWPFLAILLDDRVTEVYASVGRSPVIDHLDLGRREVANLKFDDAAFFKLKTIADSSPFTILDQLHPSAKVDLGVGNIRARISLDMDPFSPPSVDIRNLSALRSLSIPRLISGGYLDPRDASELIRGLVVGRPTLVVGPTGSGKTTLCNAILSCLPPGWRVLSVELVREIEDKENHGLMHQRFVAKNRSKEDILIDLLHRNPDLAFMGEILDKSHAEAFASAADAGLRTLATTHARDPDSLLRRWKRWHLAETVLESNLAIMGRNRALLGIFRFKSDKFIRIRAARDELSDILSSLPGHLTNRETAEALIGYWRRQK